LAVETDDVGSATAISGFGVDPSGVLVDTINDVVSFDFGAPPISGGMTSTKLVVCSVLLPGAVTDSMISVDGQASLDAPGTCVGPVNPPASGDPMPRTIGFWKNRPVDQRARRQFAAFLLNLAAGDLFPDNSK